MSELNKRITPMRRPLSSTTKVKRAMALASKIKVIMVKERQTN